MTMRTFRNAVAFALVVSASSATLAQTDSARAPAAAASPFTQGPPVRRISTASALSTEQLGSITGVRQLRDGRVLLNDGSRRRLLLLDTTLKVVDVVLDSLSESANFYGTRPGALLAYLGDTTLFVDPASYAMIVLDPEGRFARVRSVPRVRDAGQLASPSNGHPGLDTRGRLVYRINAEAAKLTSSKYFIDNFSITSNAVAVVVPPPVIGFEPTKSGMNLYSSGTGQYDRQTLRTTTPQYSWIGATVAKPVTYSLSISDYSPKVGMTTVIYLVPGSGLAVGQNYPDWGQPRNVTAFLSNNANGGGTLRLAYKNDLANTNGADPNSLYGNGSPNDLWPANPAWVAGSDRAPGTGIGGTLASVNGATITGTWSISFTSNTEVTLTSPSGETASGALPNEATAQLFADPLYAYFGTVPNEPERIGERVIFSGISITGGANEIKGDINANLTAELLEKSATVPDGILQINAADSPFWFLWSLPATDYVLQQSIDLGVGETWADIPLTTSLNRVGGKRLLLDATTVSNLKKNFLRMIKPAAGG